MDFLEEQIEGFDAQISTTLERLSPAPSDTTPPSKPPAVEAAPPAEPPSAAPSPAAAPSVRIARAATPPPPPTFALALQLALPIPGIGQRIAENALAETGTDMHRFPTSGHLTSWAGLSPGSRQSGGKRYPAPTRHGNVVLRKLMVQAAHGAIRRKGSYFGALYQRLAARRGKKRAIVAVARSLLVVYYHVLLWQEPYRELGSTYFDERKKEQVVDQLVRRLQKLGAQISFSPPAAVT
jgi:hypothetical protein